MEINPVMQGFEIIHKDEQYTVAVCPIISEEQFSNESHFNVPEIKNAKNLKRKREWFTTHKLLEEILHEPVTYTYNKLRKPKLNGRPENISISHSGNYSAVIVSKDKNIGVDIEELSPRIFKISNRFLNSAERELVNNQTKRNEMLYVIWCAKEALYKLSEVSLDFKENIFIYNFILSNAGTFKAKISHPDKNEEHTLNYRLTEKFVLVWVVA